MRMITLVAQVSATRTGAHRTRERDMTTAAKIEERIDNLTTQISELLTDGCDTACRLAAKKVAARDTLILLRDAGLDVRRTTCGQNTLISGETRRFRRQLGAAKFRWSPTLRSWVVRGTGLETEARVASVVAS